VEEKEKEVDSKDIHLELEEDTDSSQDSQTIS
jgi:hypothetical protein